MYTITLKLTLKTKKCNTFKIVRRLKIVTEKIFEHIERVIICSNTTVENIKK